MAACLIGAFATALTPTVSIAADLANVDGHGDPVLMVGPPPESAAKSKVVTSRIPVDVRAETWTDIIEYFNVDGFCKPTKVSVSLTDGPRHGTIAVQPVNFRAPGMVQMFFSAPWKGGIDPRVKCKLTSYPATRVIYTPNGQYIGDDSVILRITDNRIVSEIFFAFTIVAREN